MALTEEKLEQHFGSGQCLSFRMLLQIATLDEIYDAALGLTALPDFWRLELHQVLQPNAFLQAHATKRLIEAMRSSRIIG